MKVPDHPTLIRRMLGARVKKLAARGPVLTASLVRIAKHCGRQGCRCQRGEARRQLSDVQAGGEDPHRLRPVGPRGGGAPMDR